MPMVLITGSSGLIGAESVYFFSNKGFKIVGIDNDMRKSFFGTEASTQWKTEELKDNVPDYGYYADDIRDKKAMEAIFRKYNTDIKLIIHTAAQPSHDWAANDPHTDFSINAVGTLNLLECTRQFCPGACFIFTSTNKVYGEQPNALPFVEMESRWEVESSNPISEHGINEAMSIDKTKHSLFGASKVAADILVQEYGLYFGIKSCCFRGGCLTGPGHSAAMLHGFLAYLMKCTITGETYTIFGYKGKQVRDNIHSFDLINMFWHFYNNPKVGEVYNAGGGREVNCSILEAIEICEKITNKKLHYVYSDQNRIGDHQWYISDLRKFRSHYPEWQLTYNLEQILSEIYEGTVDRQ